MKHLDSKVEELEQYSRRNWLLIHGILHIKGEDTDKVVLNFLKKKLDIELEDDSIDRSHRLKSMATTKNKPKRIIVKSVTHNDEDWVYYNKKKLKNQEYLITESLTSVRLQCMKKPKEEYLAKKITSYWSQDGNLFYIKSGSHVKQMIKSYTDFK